nr:PLP-dependent aminotransferase family protein [Neptunomonas qingdaonensis]
MFIPLDTHLTNKNQPKYEVLYEHIKEAICHGRLKRNDKLPSSRYLSQQMGISRNSVIAAFDLLIEEGFAESRQGAGTFVAGIIELKPLLGEVKQNHLSNSVVRISEVAQRIQTIDDQSSTKPGGLQETTQSLFLPAQPAISDFPLKEWHAATARSLRDQNAYSEQPAMGAQLLRQQISEHLLITRGVKCCVDQVMITTGSQQALAIALNLLVTQNETVMLEETGYPGIDGVLTSIGAKQIALPTDEYGLCFDADNAIAQQAHTLILTPSRSFPLGQTLSLKRRLAILDWAYETQSWVIEDDYDSEFVFNGHSISALQGLDTGSRVIYTGTFSRTMFPGIRLGYMVLPEALIDLFKKYKRFVDGGLSGPQQIAMGLFMKEGGYNRHLRRMRKLYKIRKASLDHLMQQSFPDFTLVPSSGGMHSVYLLNASYCDQRICEKANANGLDIRALSAYQRDILHRPVRSGLILGYAGTPVEKMPAGVNKLQKIIKSLSKNI